jgi:hypothetical protein
MLPNWLRWLLPNLSNSLGLPTYLPTYHLTYLSTQPHISHLPPYISTYLLFPTFHPTSLPTYLLLTTYHLTSLPTYLLISTYLPPIIHLPSYVHTHLPTYLLTCLLWTTSYLLTYPSTYHASCNLLGLAT